MRISSPAFKNAGYIPLQYSKDGGNVIPLYALSKKLVFDNPPTKDEVFEAAEGHVLARAELAGKFRS